MIGTRRFYPFFAVLVGMIVVCLAIYHVLQLPPNHWYVIANIFLFAWILFYLLASHLNKRWEAPDSFVYQARTLVVIPVYNEDPRVFRELLEALSAQTRLPDRLHCVDDNSSSRECEQVFDEWAKHTPIADVVYTYLNKRVHKRRVQAIAFRSDHSAEVIITVDSDTVLDERAVEEVIKPFYEHRVMAVAGLLVGKNYRTNLLTRLVDLGFVSSFTNGRAVWSSMRSLAVSCGGLAAYRGSVVHKYLDEYVNQKIGSNLVPTGDDRMMTGFAALEGWTVYQESAVGYTLLPENLGHLTRQRIRWWRSFFWGGIWLIRKFPMNRLIWWLVAWQFASFVMFTFIFPVVLIIGPITTGRFPWPFFLYIFFLSYIRPIRYLSLIRKDQTVKQQLINYALMPLSSLLHLYIATILQYFGLATVTKSGWGTRDEVEQFTPILESHEFTRTSTGRHALHAAPTTVDLSATDDISFDKDRETDLI